MSEKNKKRLSPGWLLLIIFLLLTDLALLIRKLVEGKNMALFNPKGLIAREQHSLMLFVASVLLIVALPTLFTLFFTAWKYRESNTKAKHSPNNHHSKFLVPILWLIPITTLFVLAPVMWSATHRLPPQKQILSDTKPLRIQVISMRWKWLFIYPDQKIASVNFAQIPVDTPVEFELTADDAPMSSFWIPNLGGQLYSMTSHVNRLNLMADEPGDYRGNSAEINGVGFSGMKFTTRASSAEAFENWVETVKQSPAALDNATYNELVKPSENNPVALYSSFDRSLYDTVVMKYRGPSNGQGHH